MMVIQKTNKTSICREKASEATLVIINNIVFDQISFKLNEMAFSIILETTLKMLTGLYFPTFRLLVFLYSDFTLA